MILRVILCCFVWYLFYGVLFICLGSAVSGGLTLLGF